jgi:ArsR family transcriptional regulator
MNNALPRGTVDLFHALSDEKRLNILELLAQGERCVCDIAGPLEMKQPLLSFHLKVLRDAGILRSARVGKWVHYSIAPDVGDRLTEIGKGLKKAAREAKVVFCC